MITDSGIALIALAATVVALAVSVLKLAVTVGHRLGGMERGFEDFCRQCNMRMEMGTNRFERIESEARDTGKKLRETEQDVSRLMGRQDAIRGQ